MSPALRTVLLSVLTAAILALTLAPLEGRGGVIFDIVGFRGLADAIANLLFFVPFGVAAALRFSGWRGPVLGGMVLSCAIELTQLAIPGRFSSPLDVVFNTLGAAFGLLLIRHSEAWLRPQGRLRTALVAAAPVAGLTVLVGGSFLFSTSIPTRVLYGQWTAEFGNMQRYDGTVVSAHVGPLPVQSWRVRRSAELRQRLLTGDTIRIELIVGPPPDGLAPIFSIFDEDEQLMLLIGADGDDAVIRFRQRATSAGLDAPDLRVPLAFSGLQPGQRASLSLARHGRGYCLKVNLSAACGLGFTLGDTWGLLLYPLPRTLALVMPFVWIAALTAPAGFWIRGARPLAGTAALFIVAFALAPRFAPVLATPTPQFIAALTGLVLAYAIGVATRRSPPAAPAPASPDTDRSGRRPPRIPFPSD